MIATKKDTNWFYKFFESLCSSWIMGKRKRKCDNCKELCTLVGSNLVSILSLCGIMHKWWLLAIASAVAGITIVIFLGLQHVCNLIDSEDAEIVDNLNNQIDELNSANKKLVKRCAEERSKNSYLTSLWAETNLLVKAIQKANKQKSTKGLYSKIGNSVAAMTVGYLNIPKENLSVHLYVYDSKDGMVRRVDVESFVSTKQAADENEAKSIDAPDVKTRYYAKSLKSNKTFFVLPDNAAIREALDFPDADNEVIEQYTQYAAMACNVGGYVKLYIEIISYNGVKLGNDDNDIQLFLTKTVAPLSSILSMVSWNAIRSDCSEKTSTSK